MKLPSLLFITNLAHDDRAEDLYLADKLSNAWSVTVANPHEAVKISQYFNYCLIRNAWPSRNFEKEFSFIEQQIKLGRLRIYNPLHLIPRWFLENKNYLVELYESGYPVIPTWIDKNKIPGAFSENATMLLKPINGCSSWGIKELLLKNIDDVNGYIIQPKLSFKNEVSFFFIDGIFVYALESRWPNERWELSEFNPSNKDIEWAKQFVLWNKSLLYGIQRIDGIRLKNDMFLLMEIEDSMPYLSLLDIQDSLRDTVTKKLLVSIYNNLYLS